MGKAEVPFRFAIHKGIPCERNSPGPPPHKWKGQNTFPLDKYEIELCTKLYRDFAHDPLPPSSKKSYPKAGKNKFHIYIHVRLTCVLISAALLMSCQVHIHIYICIHIYNANLGGCGCLGAAFSMDTHIYISM